MLLFMWNIDAFIAFYNIPFLVYYNVVPDLCWLWLKKTSLKFRIASSSGSKSYKCVTAEVFPTDRNKGRTVEQ